MRSTGQYNADENCAVSAQTLSVLKTFITKICSPYLFVAGQKGSIAYAYFVSEGETSTLSFVAEVLNDMASLQGSQRCIFDWTVGRLV